MARDYVDMSLDRMARGGADFIHNEMKTKMSKRYKNTGYFLKIIRVCLATQRRVAVIASIPSPNYGPPHSFFYKSGPVWQQEIDGPLIACFNGYHLCRIEDMSSWLCYKSIKYYDIYLVKATTDEMIIEHNKVIVRNFRFIKCLSTGEITEQHWNYGYAPADFYEQCGKNILTSWGIRHRKGKILGLR